MKLFEIYAMNCGKERRNLLLEAMKTRMLEFSVGLPVDTKYHLQHWDPDLKYLLKKGLVKQVRIGSLKSRKTYYILKDKS